MIKRFTIWTVALAGLLGAGACSDTFDPSTGSGEGTVVLDIALNDDVAAPAKAGSHKAPAKVATNGREVDASQLRMTISSTNGVYEKTWETLSLFDETKERFPVGTYELAVSYGTQGEEGFDKPYYYGTTQFGVRENEVTPVSVEATLANSMVSMVYTEAFLNYFRSYTTEILTSQGNTLTYDNDANEAAYVEPGNVEVFCSVVKPNGVSARLSAASFRAEARHHYIVTVDVAKEVGDAVLTITFDSDLVNETVELDLSDEVLNAPAPTLKASGFTQGEPLTVVEGSAPAQPVRIVAQAKGALSHGILTTSSAWLNTQGWPGTVNLTTGDPTELALLNTLGLERNGFEAAGSKMAMVEFTDLIKNLKYTDGGDNSSTFTLVVTDKYSKVSDPVTFTVNVKELLLSISSDQKIYDGETSYSFRMVYNGGSTDAVTVQIKNSLGIWEKAEVTALEPVSGAEDTYNVTVKTAESGTVAIRVLAGSKTTEPLTVTRSEPNHQVETPANYAYATHAYVGLSHQDGTDATVDADAAELQLSTDNIKFAKVNATHEGTIFSLTGLKPATTYYVRAKVGGRLCEPKSFTTETATAIPNGDMETWSTSANGSNWKRMYPGVSESASVWGTNNPLTTSQGSDYAYCRISGTISSSTSHSGTAALIRTVGWGSGNTATGSKGTSGACKYTDAGLLHLGSSRSTRPAGYGSDDNKTNQTSTGPVTTDDLNLGISFASRPSALGFWYRYEPKNSADKGFAEIWVKDAAGNIVAQGTMNLDATKTYTFKQIPLTYTAASAKGATLYVRFQSTNSMEYVKRTDSNFSGPGFANLSNGTFMGSQLYIDDVTLEY